MRKKNIQSVIAATVISMLGACAGESETNTVSIEDEFDLTKMMANVADNIIVPTYEKFAVALQEAKAPENVISAYCEQIGNPGEQPARLSAQAQWLELMNIWQEAELFILGPAADNANEKRNAIFSYASNFPPSSCAVDQSVVLAQQPNFDIASRAFNSRGLDALEYLLFNDNLNHTCPVQISETQDWNAQSEQSRKQQRCNYAMAVVEDLSNQATTLLSSWQITGGDYRTEFVNPVNVSQNLSALSDAIFYLELETKDDKLGLPTGIQSNCTQAACPAGVESPFSKTSLTNISTNLKSFRTVFNGADGLGFDDLINQSGFPQVTRQFNNDIDTAIAFIETIDTPLIEQSQTQLMSGDNTDCLNSAANPDSIQTVPMCSLHGYLKRISDLLRVDFITIVNLDLPDRGQSDND